MCAKKTKLDADIESVGKITRRGRLDAWTINYTYIHQSIYRLFIKIILQENFPALI
jgi:hypothetical protein